jgi:hypothetical protein
MQDDKASRLLRLPNAEQLVAIQQNISGWFLVTLTF